MFKLHSPVPYRNSVNNASTDVPHNLNILDPDAVKNLDSGPVTFEDYRSGRLPAPGVSFAQILNGGASGAEWDGAELTAAEAKLAAENVAVGQAFDETPHRRSYAGLMRDELERKVWAGQVGNPSPSPDWPTYAELRQILIERAAPESLPAQQHRIAGMVQMVERLGWSREQVEQFLDQRGFVVVPIGLFPYDPEAFEGHVDRVESKLIAAGKAQAAGKEDDADSLLEDALESAKAAWEEARRNAIGVAGPVINARKAGAWTRVLVDALVRATGDVNANERRSHMIEAAGATIALRDPTLHRGDDDADRFEPFDTNLFPRLPRG